jgi:hypothetical protein
MEPLLIRFEQRRGHYMIIERDPPISRNELNETQMQMLKQCDIPGLLPQETEENDGQLSLRYLLSGKRMLSEALRSTDWSMYDMMGALCRLGEVLEECRLHLLDADRIRLYDEYIFVGQDWHDLRFTYIPIDMPTLHRADDLERLIIRWMLKVKEPDGQVMQYVLRLVTTQGFMPISLSRYARKYLAESLDVGGQVSTRSQISSISGMPMKASQKDDQDEPKHTARKRARTWDIFQPPSGDPHTVSELWGDESELREELHPEVLPQAIEPAEGEIMPLSRWRIILCCIGFLILSLGWRFLYLNDRTEQKLLYCLCLSLVVTSGIVFLWKAVPDWSRRSSNTGRHSGSRISSGGGKQVEEQKLVDDQPWVVEPRFPRQILQSTSRPSDGHIFSPHHENKDKQLHSPETTWLAEPNDQTTFLNPIQSPPRMSCYLVWESKEPSGERIPLQGNSLIIGRSSEASSHVDLTVGISRAHAEFIKVSEEWKVKDLGSRNGSRLNELPMAAYELYSLQTGDCLTLGSSQYRFHNGA